MRLFFKKRPSLSKPKVSSLEGRWMLNRGGEVTSSFCWEDVLQGLKALWADEDSFLTMERKDPYNSRDYWFVQCALALTGPNEGQYIVEYGCSSPEGPKMFEKCVPALEQVLPYFKNAYEERKPDLSDFRDLSIESP